MLGLSVNALSVIRQLTHGEDVPLDAGVRIAAGDDMGTSITVHVAEEPHGGDLVIDDWDVRLFVEPTAAAVLRDRTLDAELDADGEVTFTVNDDPAASARSLAHGDFDIKTAPRDESPGPKSIQGEQTGDGSRLGG